MNLSTISPARFVPTFGLEINSSIVIIVFFLGVKETFGWQINNEKIRKTKDNVGVGLVQEDTHTPLMLSHTELT